MTKPAPIAGKVPPYAEQAEGIVLCQFLTLTGDDARDKPERRELDATAEMLRAEHFYADCNRRIWQGILAAREAGKVPTTIFVDDWLKSHGFEHLAPPAYVEELASKFAWSLKVREQAQIVIDKWRLRRLIDTGHKIIGAAYGATGDVGAFITAAESEFLLATANEGEQEHIPSLDEAMFNEIDRIITGEGKVTRGIYTGLYDVDRIAGPMEPGDLVVIGAHSGVGKTSLVMQVAMHVAINCKVDGMACEVYMASQEMTVEQLGRRALSGALGIDTRIIATGNIGHEAMTAIVGLGEKIKIDGTAAARIRIDERTAVTPTQLRNRSRQIQREATRWGTKLALVIVDYLQLMDGSDGTKRSNERFERELSYIAESLKNMAKKLGCVVIALGQLNDDARKENRMPRGEDMAGCKAIRAPADKFYLINNDSALARRQQEQSEDEDKATLPPEIVQILIDKNRGGREQMAVAQFYPSSSRFEDLKPDQRREYYERRKAERQAREQARNDRSSGKGERR